ncbi:DUF2530 domain-containing protein [Actinopolyspora mortivallis]|uniref:DUF2530 domain-containing protein n=1 Tax=Actinopolyspora mortivallis TaxID=33906 RepID=UPI0003A6EDAC|nr:DUF2530 domain-containing protein [Actinopolyspora mortivallis]
MPEENTEASRGPTPMRPVPALPRRLAEPTPVVLTGTLCWLVAALVFGVWGWATGSALDTRFWTSVVGTALGVLGYGLFRWQRAASRRGSPGAWRGLAGLDE